MRRFSLFRSVFDLADKEATIARMELEATKPGYWDDSRQAQRQMRQLVRLKDTASVWKELRSQSQALLELADLGLEEGDYSLQDQLEVEAGEISRILAREEIKLTLSGPYDDRPAIVSIHAGAEAPTLTTGPICSCACICVGPKPKSARSR